MITLRPIFYWPDNQRSANAARSTLVMTQSTFWNLPHRGLQHVSTIISASWFPRKRSRNIPYQLNLFVPSSQISHTSARWQSCPLINDMQPSTTARAVWCNLPCWLPTLKPCGTAYLSINYWKPFNTPALCTKDLGSNISRLTPFAYILIDTKRNTAETWGLDLPMFYEEFRFTHLG